MGTLALAESHSSQNEGSVHCCHPCPCLCWLCSFLRGMQHRSRRTPGEALQSQLRSRLESSSPKFAPRLMMPLLARRVLPPGGLTWPCASTPLSLDPEMPASVLAFARRGACLVSGPATTAPL